MAARKDYQAKKAVESANQQTAGEEVVQVLTVNGQPIPEHVKHLITYEMTDQGIAAESAKRKERGVATPGVSVAEDAWDKRVEQFARDEATGSEPWEQADPIQAAISRVPDSKGKAFHLFGGATFDRDGDRGFVPERDGKGNLIKVGNMVLASMDAHRAKRREEHYKRLSDDAAQTHGEVELERNASQGITPLKPGETVEGRAAFSGLDAPASMGHTRTVSAGEILTGG